ncbi:tRNA(Met) cytidine acetyltransferase TmcA [Marinobacter sp. AN1]|uniref:tRNA(Met) cytidine acetyltransferase TmcA n=1 Tax=Marinobacter sp. AN1 TaxID=2886046 RepID=UPI00222E4CE2|nr:GNAT family N-acetyltransferase [Marinobacter sp. AN1]UZD65468.1 GNAT family N-acetyltransferase [Marinobacter sp. AN1]
MNEGSWQALSQRLSARGERRLVLVEGAREQALALVNKVMSELAPSGGLWVGEPADLPHPALTAISANQARQHLGTENPVLVWDGWHGNPPDSLAALSGTLQAGGLWFWLMPELAEWDTFADPDYARMGLPAEGQHPFMARMARILAEDSSVIRLEANGDGAPPLLPVDDVAIEPFRPAATSDQERAIEHILHTGQGRRRRPLVITADRGRGKSAALGIAAVRLLQGGRHRILVVSPRKENVSTLFRHAAAEAGHDYTGQTLLELSSGETLQWLPVDELLARRPEAELVMVDEAAAIPAPLLRQILLGWPRVVFASTVHGYEGSGRGFNLRFRAVLDRETPHWQGLTMEQPVRWSSSDPLETLVNHLFLLDASAVGPVHHDEVVIEKWRPAEASEQDLSNAFGLLVDAHYRTTPGDLRQWMDDPGAVTLVARQGADIVGVLWATVEGGLDTELAHKVMRGERRLKGHLLPQSLANHGGDTEAATLRMLRVVRLAVNDQCRRRGIGQDLLDHAVRQASDLGLDAIGTSYGASQELLPFWQSAGFKTVRLGISREASSGEYAVQMLQGLTDRGVAAQQRLSKRFSEQWPVMLPVVWPSLSPELVLAITSDLPPAPPLTEQERIELEAFAHGHRGFELTLAALRRLTLQAGLAARLLSSEQASLWVASVFQSRTWPDLRLQGLCQGQRDGESRVRKRTSSMLSE